MSQLQWSAPGEHVMHIGELRSMIIHQLPRSSLATMATVNRAWWDDCTQALYGARSRDDSVPLDAFQGIADERKGEYARHVRHVHTSYNGTDSHIQSLVRGASRIQFPRLESALISCGLNKMQAEGMSFQEGETKMYDDLFSPTLRSLALNHKRDGFYDGNYTFFRHQYPPPRMIIERLPDLNEFRIMGLIDLDEWVTVVRDHPKLKVAGIDGAPKQLSRPKIVSFIHEMRKIPGHLTALRMAFGNTVGSFAPDFDDALSLRFETDRRAWVKKLQIESAGENFTRCILACIPSPKHLESCSIKLSIDLQDKLDPRSFGLDGCPTFTALRTLQLSMDSDYLWLSKDLLLHIPSFSPNLETLFITAVRWTSGKGEADIDNDVLLEFAQMMPELRSLVIHGYAAGTEFAALGLVDIGTPLWTPDVTESMFKLCPRLEKLKLLLSRDEIPDLRFSEDEFARDFPFSGVIPRKGRCIRWAQPTP